jgi:iron transport multicopper oxidase
MEGKWMSRMLAMSAACTLLLLLATTGQALASGDDVSGLTNSGDSLRTGWYPENPIKPEVLSGGTFGQLWSSPVEGQVYAQPLLDNGTLLVATENNRVYGLNPESGTSKWSTSLGTPWKASDIGCGDLTPTIGVTATPVIDPSTNTAYLTHKTYVSGSSGAARWYMDAINMSSGAENAGFPVELSGKADNAPGQEFEPKTELQRPGLLLLEGVVYAAFGSDCDIDPYQGWVFGVSTAEHKVTARWTAEEFANGGGIWQSGAGLTSDGPGTILISTGNGGTPEPPTPGSKPPGALGEAVVRLQVQGNGSLQATDFFAPFDAAALSAGDADFASGGVTGLPEEYFGTPKLPHLAVAVGKDGYVYLLNRDELGGIGEGPSGSDKVVQRIGPYGGVWSRPGVWPGEGGWVYIPTASNGKSAGGSAGRLMVYRYGLSGTGAPTLSREAESSEEFGFSSSAPVITSEGTTPGTALVWVVWAPNGTGVGAQLQAYDPRPVNGHPVLRWSAPVGTSAKFALPGVGAGRLYVGTRDGHVLAFGSPITPVLTGSATAFPPTTVGSSSAPKTVTLTATEPIVVSSLVSSSTEFTLGASSPSLPATLATGETIKVPVTFSPAKPGPQAGILTATTSTGKTASFGLSGTGQAATAQLEASPTVLSFGGTAIGHEVSSAATFRNVGSVPLTINAVNGPSKPFTAAGAPAAGSKIEPGQSIIVTITFDPEAAGQFEGQIELETTAGNGKVVLTGSGGTAGALQIASETNDYGQVPIGSSATKNFTVTNTGGSAVVVTKSKPPSGGAFSATTPLAEGTTIAPGETLTETVKFTPSASGEATGVWLLNGNDTTGVHEVKFTGVGHILGAPTVQTNPATSVERTSATLNATVNPNGGSVSQCQFEYGTSTAYGSSAPCATSPGSGKAPVNVSAAISGLSQGTVYYVRITARNPTGTNYSGAATFTTFAPKLPSVETHAATSVGQASATLNATVDPNGETLSGCRFDYGTSPSYGSIAPCASLPGAGTASVPVSANVGSLSAGTTYYARIVASAEAGPSYGAPVTFTTSSVPTPETPSQTPPQTPSQTLVAPLAAQGILSAQESKVPAIPIVKLLSGSLLASPTGAVTAKLSCPAGESSCAGTIRLWIKVEEPAGHGSRTNKLVHLTLASGSFTVAGGGSTNLRLRLTATARARLARAHLLRATATILAHDPAGARHETQTLVNIRLAKGH